jgi:hypothetical protein
VILAAAPVVAMAQGNLNSRGLHCERYELARSREICRAFEREMEWKWMGHAIVAPGFRVTWGSIRRVYCTLHVDAKDTQSLVQIVLWHRKGEWNDDRIEFGATALLKLLGRSALQALPDPRSVESESGRVRLTHLKVELEQTVDDEKFVYHPSNSQYILRDGCPSQ